MDVRYSVWAEQSKIPVAVARMPGAYFSTETNFIPIRGVMKKFLFGHTKTHGIKAPWTARAPALART